ncbi:MAG TPA: hypothetical protein VGF12_07120 [Roseateles sp.]|uniref:hypothetical protein n=1 Tax=Roseateles sp. TaxID=1971397 RepID=UPI002ED9C2A6
MSDEFLQGVCVALQHVKACDAVAWGEIVRAVGEDDMLRYAAHIEPEEWELAGFDQHAKSELGRGKPRKATTLRYRAADGTVKTTEFPGELPPQSAPSAHALVEQCRAALAEELSAWDIDPPLHHVKQAHDACVSWLAANPINAGQV